MRSPATRGLEPCSTWWGPDRRRGCVGLGSKPRGSGQTKPNAAEYAVALHFTCLHARRLVLRNVQRRRQRQLDYLQAAAEGGSGEQIAS